MSQSRNSSNAVRRVLISLLVTVLASAGVFAVSASAQTAVRPAPKPTIVLVHGAFADASGWNGVAERLTRKGYPVIAPANPLRGLSADSAYLHSFLSQVDGPVLLVGHSYGGAVITNAAVGASNVVGLVYVSGFAPDEGERLIDVEAGSKDSVLDTALVSTNYPTAVGSQTAVEYSIDPAKFRAVFAADLPARQTRLMAITQRPTADAAFSEASGPAAWKSLPSWAVIATGDKAAGSDVLVSMAQRAGAEITMLKGSHVIMISKPKRVADVIIDAAEATGRHS